MVHIANRPINLDQLQTALIAAGVSITGLVMNGDPSTMTGADLLQTDAQGRTSDLPAIAVTVIAAHVPQPTELDVSATDLNTSYQAALARLDAIVSATTLTQTQMQQAIQDEARMLRRLLRFVFNAVTPKRP